MWPSDDQLRPFLDVIGNSEAIAVNQAWFGHPGMLIDEVSGPGHFPLNKMQLWMKPMGTGGAAVFVLNYCAVPQNYTLKLDALSFNGAGVFVAGGAVAVRDVWARSNNGTAAGSIALALPAYDSVFLRLSSPKA